MLIIILLMMAAYSAVIIYQIGHMEGLVTETNEKQKRSIAAVSQQTMDAVMASSMGQSTQLEAYIANDLFQDLAGTVGMVGDYAGMIFRNPSDYAPMPMPGWMPQRREPSPSSC